jgi:hypothetical protein
MFEERKGPLPQTGDEPAQSGDATVHALYIIDPLGDLHVLDGLDLIRVSLDSSV